MFGLEEIVQEHEAETRLRLVPHLAASVEAPVRARDEADSKPYVFTGQLRVAIGEVFPGLRARLLRQLCWKK